MNTRSNLAYNHHVAVPYSEPQVQAHPNVRIRVSNKKQRAAAKRANAFSILRFALVVFCAFLVLYRGLVITEKCNAVEQKRNELNALITSNEKLQFEIDRSLDLKHVEAVAQNELGMRRAEKYQTIYIDLEQVDYVEKTAKHQFSPISRIAEFCTGLMAYLD